MKWKSAFSGLLAVSLLVLGLACSQSRDAPAITEEEYLPLVEATLEVIVEPAPTRVPRLEFPTLTVEPTSTPAVAATPLPTLDINSQVEAVVPTPAPAPPATCVEHLQLVLANYTKAEIFPEDVQEVHDRLSELRGDCGSAVVSYDVECERGTYIGGLQVTGDLLNNPGDYLGKSIGGTGLSPLGDVLVHFLDMPERDGPGCWYYSLDRQRWSWRTSSGEYGMFGVDHSMCDGRLRELVLALGAEKASEVAVAVDRVWREIPSCKVQGWSPFPRNGGVEVCGFDGVDEAVVIRWQDYYQPYDGAQCWAYNRELMEWYVGY